MSEPLFIAVDLGAGSGRVFLADVGRDGLSLEEVHRFYYPPEQKNGHLRWNFSSIFADIISGLKQAASRAKAIGRSIRSVGIDSWAVDYGLLDANLKLIDDPVCYRDYRTSNAMQQVFQQIPRRSIFEKTGIQFQNFNTLFQLWSERESLRNAKTFLLIPDLINYFLTGKVATEFTNATTTQMLNATSGCWDQDLVNILNLPARFLPYIIPAGSDLGKLKAEIANETSLQNIQVIAPATHDTASAVAAAPLSSNWAYISSGTWSLIGVELEKPLINEAVERENFTNEGGAYGTTRFLKNVMGLWIFECCRKEWKDRGLHVEYDALVNEVSGRPGFPSFIFPDDPRFLNPASMLDALKDQLLETGQRIDDDPVSTSKMIFDSLAFRYASVLRAIEPLIDRKLNGVFVLGGGGRNRYLNQMTADASGMRIKSGLYEATVLGNVLVQAISAGGFESLSEARKYVTESVEFVDFVPQSSRWLSDAAGRYAEIENRYINL